MNCSDNKIYRPPVPATHLTETARRLHERARQCILSLARIGVGQAGAIIEKHLRQHSGVAAQNGRTAEILCVKCRGENLFVRHGDTCYGDIIALLHLISFGAASARN